MKLQWTGFKAESSTSASDLGVACIVLASSVKSLRLSQISEASRQDQRKLQETKKTSQLTLEGALEQLSVSLARVTGVIVTFAVRYFAQNAQVFRVALVQHEVDRIGHGRPCALGRGKHHLASREPGILFVVDVFEFLVQEFYICSQVRAIDDISTRWTKLSCQKPIHRCAQAFTPQRWRYFRDGNTFLSTGGISGLWKVEGPRLWNRAAMLGLLQPGTVEPKPKQFSMAGAGVKNFWMVELVTVPQLWFVVQASCTNNTVFFSFSADRIISEQDPKTSRC